MKLTNKSKTIILVGSLFLFGLIFRLWASQPNWMHYDENYYINITQNFVTRGELTPYMWRLGNLPIISGGGSGYGILILILWLKAVNFSLFWGRVLMVVVNLITAGIIYFVANRWWSSRLAGLAAFGYAIVAPSSFNTIILKMDAIGILSYTLVLLLYILAYRKQKFWLHFLVGVAIVATAEFHVLGTIYILAIGFCYLYEFIRNCFANRKFILQQDVIGFGLGALLAGLIYLAVHVFPDPKAYFIISNSCFECNESVFLTEFKRLIRMIILRPQEIIIILFVILLAWKRNKDADRHFLVLILGWLVAQAIIGPPPYDHYFNHFWPVVAIGVGGLVAFGSNYKMQTWRVPVCVITAFVLLFANMGLNLLGNYQSLISYRLVTIPEVQYIQANVNKNEVVMGNIPDFYYLRDYPNYLSYRDGDAYGTALRGESMLTFWRRIQPKAIILDKDRVDKDPELQQYIAEAHLKHVMPNLWVQ